MYDHLYGVDSLRSGVFHFDSHNDREYWLLESDTRQALLSSQVDREVRSAWQGKETFGTWADLIPGDFCEGRWTALSVRRDGDVVHIETDKGHRSDLATAQVVVWRHPKVVIPGTNLIITDPGKFEGQRSIVEDAYNIYLDGFADDDGEIITAFVPVEYRGQVPTKFETVQFTETEQGFIEEVRS